MRDPISRDSRDTFVLFSSQTVTNVETMESFTKKDTANRHKMFVHFSLLKKAEWCSTAQHATTKPKKTCFKPPSLNDSQHEPTIMESMANKKSLNALRV
jgi:hypothetical protein